MRPDGKTGSRFAMPIKLFGEPLKLNASGDDRAAERLVVSNARLLDIGLGCFEVCPLVGDRQPSVAVVRVCHAGQRTLVVADRRDVIRCVV